MKRLAHGLMKLLMIGIAALGVILLFEKMSAGKLGFFDFLFNAAVVCGAAYVIGWPFSRWMIYRWKPLKWMDDQQAEFDQKWNRWQANNARRAAVEAENRAQYERQKARDDEVWHRNKARQYAGTRDGEYHKHKAWEARERAKR